MNKVITSLAKKFNLKEQDFVSFPYGEGTAIVYAGQTKYEGSYDAIMAQPKKNWEIRVNNKRYDTRKFMTLDLYKAFMGYCNKQNMNPMPDSINLPIWTCTWLTGEPVQEINGESRVPYGYWHDGQVKSDLDWADVQDDDFRPRLAVVIPHNSELDSSSVLSPLTSPGKDLELTTEDIATWLQTEKDKSFQAGWNEALKQVRESLPSEMGEE